jgi:ubiquinone/menaquinone biosynthesis C-methylase UbiE
MKLWQEVERIDESMPGYYFAEHLARYRFVAERIPESSRVLDLGCGIGYGSRSICEHVNSLVGLDISEEAIRKARFNYAHSKIRYLVSQGQSLPFANHRFDAVISFEVIEHLSPTNQAAYLSEIARVLTEDGVAYISTPNRRLTAGRANPFHIKEFYYEELRRFLSHYFEDIELFGQKCTNSAAEMYRTKTATFVRQVKERLKIQFLLPRWAKRILEVCLTGSTMSRVGVDDYKFMERHVEECEVFLAICRKKRTLVQTS